MQSGSCEAAVLQRTRCSAIQKRKILSRFSHVYRLLANHLQAGDRCPLPKDTSRMIQMHLRTLGQGPFALERSSNLRNGNAAHCGAAC